MKEEVSEPECLRNRSEQICFQTASDISLGRRGPSGLGPDHDTGHTHGSRVGSFKLGHVNMGFQKGQQEMLPAK